MNEKENKSNGGGTERGEEVMERERPDLLDFYVEVAESPAYIVNPAEVGNPCICYRLDGGEVCYSKGAIGTLSKEQVEKYCIFKHYVESERLKRRVKEWKKAAEKCKVEVKKYPKGERLLPFLECMSREAKEGI